MGAPQGGAPSNVQSLASSLRAASPPINPQTPNDRSDPQEQLLIAYQRIRWSTDEALKHVGDDNPITQALLHAVHSAATKLLAGIDPQQVVQMMVVALQGAHTVPSPNMPGAGGVPGPATPGMGGSGMPPAPSMPVAPPVASLGAQ